MNCPICKNVKLIDAPVEQGLESAMCSGCGGQWIISARYWQWLEARKASGEYHPSPEGAMADPATQLPVNDSAAGKFCPGCGRFLARVKPGHGLEFFVNRCGGCGGIWLDRNEWENLKSAGLHDDIHFIFSDSWQADVVKVERTRQHEQLLAEKLGPDALAEIKRIKAWLDTHPKKAELYAYLVGPKDSGPSKR